MTHIKNYMSILFVVIILLVLCLLCSCSFFLVTGQCHEVIQYVFSFFGKGGILGRVTWRNFAAICSRFISWLTILVSSHDGTANYCFNLTLILFFVAGLQFTSQSIMLLLTTFVFRYRKLSSFLLNLYFTGSAHIMI